MASTSTDTDGLHQPDSVVTPAFVTATPAASSSTTSSSATEAGGVSPATTTSKARLEDLVDGSGGQQTTADGPSSSSDGVPAASADATSGSESGGNSNDSTYECTICLETAKDAVVSLCGHLFCWPCLHQWLETRPQRQMCPVCKAAISKDKVIPLYGRDSKNQQDPRTKAPPRPTAQRTEPETSTFHGFGFPDGGGFHMSFGIGAFPFGFFTSSFNFGSEARPPNPSEEEQFLSKLFLWVGILFLAWLILA